MLKAAQAVALAIAALAFMPAARADALPPPAELTDMQKSRIGVWIEQPCSRPYGHICASRVFIFGNETVALSSLGVEPGENYFAHGSGNGAWFVAVEEGLRILTIAGETITGERPWRFAIAFEQDAMLLTNVEKLGAQPVRFVKVSGMPGE